MTTLFDEPSEFAAESLRAFASANADRVTQVGSGVVRRADNEPIVAIVTGGGAGHFPAFIGWVGVGMATGAVSGNIFSSPSEHQILEVARRANRGNGILFIPINYAGDILHFTAARDQLNSESIETRMVAVTDDIASGDAAERQLRRGIAGSLIVIKIAGAAAERGYAIDHVERIAMAANEVTRSFGVAFSGCTVPGEDSPLFTVPPGRMALGLGIHGEPGIAEDDLGTASDVADELVDGLFAERTPIAGQRIAVVVNGLGSTKYDELNIVFGHVRRRLEAAHMNLVAPVVGEYVTSLDMAGLSLSIAYLDDELADLWCDPVDSAAYSRRRVSDAEFVDVAEEPAEVASLRPVFNRGSDQSRAAADIVLKGIEQAAAIIDAEAGRLGDIDAVAGDGDHGVGMQNGIRAALYAARRAYSAEAGVGSMLEAAGDDWSNVAGGTSGALWGEGLKAAGKSLGDNATITGEKVARAVEAFTNAIAARGGATLGDKTMLDAIIPFSEALTREAHAGSSGTVAWRRAAQIASAAASATANIVSKRGRSRIYGARTIGTPDAGAISFALIVSSFP